MTVTQKRDTAGNRGRSLRRPAVLAWLRLARVAHKVEQAAAEQVRPFELSLGQFDVLATAGAQPGLTQQDLADKLLVTKGNVCQLLDKMQRDGLILRLQDGRANRVHLTDKGRDLFDEVVPLHENAIARAFTSLSQEEQTQLHALLSKLDRALE